ncbi:MAG: hypothetical protein QUS14_02360 [Pyrinomonadaceae bacterium]|nr:hypothetical protein [Pyrinomonadaceae bacterium]
MKEAEVKFEREQLHGLVAVGSYLSDATKRFGIRQSEPCSPASNEHHCEISVVSGADHLSAMTAAESEYFAGTPDAEAKRLACQTRIDSPGEIVIMTNEQPKAAETESAKAASNEEEYIKAFGEMPLDRKIASLVKLEAMALGDTLAYIANSPYTIAEKAIDILAGFGFKMHESEKAAARPKEHTSGKEQNGNGITEDEVVEAESNSENPQDARGI